MDFLVGLLNGILVMVGILIAIAITCIIGVFLWCLAGTIILEIIVFFDNLQK